MATLTIPGLDAQLKDVTVKNSTITAMLASDDGTVAVSLAGSIDNDIFTLSADPTGSLNLSHVASMARLADAVTALSSLTNADGTIAMTGTVTLAGTYDGTTVSGTRFRASLNQGDGGITLDVAPSASLSVTDAVASIVVTATGAGVSAGCGLTGTLARESDGGLVFTGTLVPDADGGWLILAGGGSPLPDGSDLADWLVGSDAPSVSGIVSAMTLGTEHGYTTDALRWSVANGDGTLVITAERDPDTPIVTTMIELPDGNSLALMPNPPKGQEGTAARIPLSNAQNSPFFHNATFPGDNADSLTISELSFYSAPGNNATSFLRVLLSGAVTLMDGLICIEGAAFTVIKVSGAHSDDPPTFTRLASAQLGFKDSAVTATVLATADGTNPITWSFTVTADFIGTNWTVGNLLGALGVPGSLGSGIYFANFGATIATTPGTPTNSVSCQLVFGFATMAEPQPADIINAVYWQGIPPTAEDKKRVQRALYFGPLAATLSFQQLFDFSSGDLPALSMRGLGLTYADAVFTAPPSNAFPPMHDGIIPKGFCIVPPQISLTTDSASSGLTGGSDGGAPATFAWRAAETLDGDDDKPEAIEPQSNPSVPVEVQTRGLQIASLGFSFDNTGISLQVDGALAIMGNQFLFMSLTISQPLALALPSFSLYGLGMLLGDPSKPPAVSGALHLNLTNDAIPVTYQGILTIYAERAITFGAILGTDPATKDNFGFGFMVLTGMHAGSPAMTLQGMALGLGIGMTLAPPTLSSMSNYPLIDLLKADEDTSNAVDDLYGVFTSLFQNLVTETPGQNCALVGAHILTQEIVEHTAVLNVRWGGTTVIDLFGQSQMILPPKAKAPGIMTDITLSFDGTLLPSEGVLQVLFQIVPGSYLFNPGSSASPSEQMLISGGGAVCVWFAGPYDGAFVITLGGYRAGWTPPHEYPTVSRVAVTWQPAKTLSCLGEAYFTLCSMGVMAGMSVRCSWNGAIGTHLLFAVTLTFSFDVMCTWLPFGFELDASIQISVSATVSLGFVHFSLNVSLGASLSLAGVPFYGTASFYIQGWALTLEFGTPPPPARSVSWQEFVALLMPTAVPAAGQGAEVEMVAVTQTGTSASTPAPVSIAVTAGIVPTSAQSNDPSVPIVVDPGTLAFNVTTSVPLLSATALGATVPLDGISTSYVVVPMQSDDAVVTTSTIQIVMQGTAGAIEGCGFTFGAPLTGLATANWNIPDGGSGTNGTVPAVTTITVAVEPPTVADDAHTTFTPLSELLASPDDIAVALPSPETPDPNAFAGQTIDIAQAICDPTTAATRASLLDCLNGLGFPVSSASIDLNLVPQTGLTFTSQPLLRELGAGTYVEAAA